MERLNLSGIDDVSLVMDGQTYLSIPFAKIYSWAIFKHKQNLMLKTVEYLKSWYEKQNTIENVMNNIRALWDKLTDAVAENNYNDYIAIKYLELNKDDLTARYNEDCMQPFLDGLKYITDFWYSLTLDEAEMKAYRENRKDSRSRAIGIGFGLGGSLKASAGAGLTNMATGAAHGIFNSIVNGVDSIKKNNQLKDFYWNESTCDSLIMGWKKSFWQMIDIHIEEYNNRVISDDSVGVQDVFTVLDSIKSAGTKYKNLKQSDLSGNEYFKVLFECIAELPYGETFWYELVSYMGLCGVLDQKKYSGIKEFGTVLYNLVPSYMDIFNNEVILALVNISTVNFKDRDTEANSNIIDILNEELKDESCHKQFNLIVKNTISAGKDESNLKELLRLLAVLDETDINEFRNDGDIAKKIEGALRDISASFITAVKDDVLLPELQNGNIDKAATEIINAPLVDPEIAMNILASHIIVLMDDGKVTITKEFVENIEHLISALNLGEDYKSTTFSMIKERINEPEAIEDRKTHTLAEKYGAFFYSLEKYIMENNGKEVMGKHAYWGKDIPPKIIKNMRNSLGIPEKTVILAVFDNTLLSSGKSGLAMTSDGLSFKNSEYHWHIAWEELALKCKTVLEASNDGFIFQISFEGLGNSGSRYKRPIEFSDNGADISAKKLLDILYLGCQTFFVAHLRLGYEGEFEQKQDFDISKLVFAIPHLGKLETDNIDAFFPRIESEILKAEDTKEPLTAKKQEEPAAEAKPIKSEERFNYLREDDRIYIAKKFKERKGFFRHILPASWILTIGFYGLVALIIMMVAYIAIPQNTETIRLIIALLTVVVIPIALWVFGIKKRVKYIREKKKWKECTDFGKRDIKDVYKEFQEMENEYIGL